MSELKARTARSIADAEEMLELGADCPIEPAQVYLKSEVENVIAEKDKEIAELKAQKAQAEDDCAFWKNLAQKNATDNDNAVKAKQRAEAIKHYMELADKLKEKK